MKKWKVYAISTIQYEIEVIADNEEEAMDKAENIDGSEWKEEEAMCSDWEVIRAEEVVS